MLDHTELNGIWQLRAVAEFSRDIREEPWDAPGWLTQELPAHWQEHPALIHHSGKVVYRRRVRVKPVPERRTFLRFSGIFYRYSAYLNGHLLGQGEGYFAPAEFEVTGRLTGDDLIVLEVDCPREERKLGKRLITGIFSHWDHLDPKLEPGGVWLPVELVYSGTAKIDRLGVETRRFDPQSAKVRLTLDVDAAALADPLLVVTFTPANFPGEPQTFKFRTQLKPGANRITQECAVERYRLWWPHDLGE
ncbi:MAG: glycoside hydrolase, partial [Methanocella sp.]